MKIKQLLVLEYNAITFGVRVEKLLREGWFMAPESLQAGECFAVIMQKTDES